jgi:SPP1 family predicted phage head-tail adaptor
MGAPTEAWEDLKTVWGAVWPLRGREYILAQQVGADVNYKIRIRYTEDITPANRIQLADTTRFFDIKEVINPDLRNIQLELMCKEAV